MKSPMVNNSDYIPDEEKRKYSELQVLHSAAGYYIGTIYTDKDGCMEPGSRDSGYFKNFKLAQDYLDKLNEDPQNAEGELRDHP